MPPTLHCGNGHTWVAADTARDHGAHTCPVCGESAFHPDPPRPAPPTLPSVPGFDLLEQVGEGGMGVVFRAREHNPTRIVALKVILAGPFARESDRQRFRAEAEVIAQLQHPNIVPVYAVGEVDRCPYFTMEFVEGGTLRARLGGRPLDFAAAADLVARLARAVAYIHEKGVVHRDLKPDNILFAADGTPKVTDFGVAKRLADGSGVTRTGALLGTVWYMAPEQAAGRKDVGPLADVYALGAILYECVTGRPPFLGENPLEVLQQVKTEPPTSPAWFQPGLPRDLETICMKCLAKDPADRYPSAAALADDLDRHRADLPILAGDSRVTRAVKWCRRNRASLRLGGLAGCAAAATYFVLADSGARIPTGAWGRDRIDSAGLSVFRPIHSDAEVRSAAAAHRRELVGLMTARALQSDGWIARGLGANEPPTLQVWSQSQSLYAVLKVPDVAPAELARYAPGLEAPFRPGLTVEAGGRRYGWRSEQGVGDRTPVIAYPAVWTAAALSAALARPGFIPQDRRNAVLDRLVYTQDALRPFHEAPAGGWSAYPNPDDPTTADTYTTALALLALVEAHRAGLPWDGSAARRDELLRAAWAYLVGRYDVGSPVPGWRGSGTSSTVTLDALTLQVYATLLTAEAAVGLETPAPIFAGIPAHLAGCADRPFTFPDSLDSTNHPHTDPAGFRRNGQEAVTYLWYPWAVAAAALWLDRAEARGATTRDRVRVRRALGHLAVDLGPHATARAGREYTYLTAELLAGLSHIPPPADEPAAPPPAATTHP